MKKTPEEPGGERFLYPHLLFEILCVAVIVTEIVVVLAIAFPPPIRRAVNFAFPYAPRPAWYFLPLYELVKYTPGSLTFVGAVLFPMTALGLLFLVPWLDKSPERTIRERPLAGTAALLAVLITLFLLWQGWRS